jgi:hypothetical protein
VQLDNIVNIATSETANYGTPPDVFVIDELSSIVLKCQEEESCKPILNTVVTIVKSRYKMNLPTIVCGHLDINRYKKLQCMDTEFIKNLEHYVVISL